MSINRATTENGSLRNLRSEVDQLFDSFFGTGRQGGQTRAAAVWAPPVDLREDENNYYVSAELPGLKLDDINIELENNTLTLKGERRFERKQDGENYHVVERSYGSFFRSFMLPKNVNVEAIDANYADGVLSITLPKREEVKPRKVEIRTAGDGRPDNKEGSA
jgi:HSP20 family protein